MCTTRVIGNKRVTLQMTKRPLSEVLAAVARVANVPIDIDWPSLAPLGIRPGVATSINVQDTPFITTIRIACAREGVDANAITLALNENRDGLRVVSMYDQRFRVTRRYPIDDFILYGDKTGAILIADLLKDRSVFPLDQSWEHSLAIDGNVLVVNHSLRGHQEVQASLDQLRAYRGGLWRVAALSEGRK